uniref:RING-type domain-containing protein n=2 Tax=Spongospora subterranea TaxID=70186 RepID=A0A0H5QQI5_9EUKA|eukprot:CRZ04288.1 hypothetical protein [Spongospora subterranea]
MSMEELNCPICYETLSVPTICPCGHSFCSICIRRYLKLQKKCPICNQVTDPTSLIANRPLDAVIALILPKNPSLKGLGASPFPTVNVNAVCRERLPILSVDMVSDKVLREHLSRFGVDSKGARAEIESRWIEFSILYEANQDRATPHPISAVVKSINDTIKRARRQVVSSVGKRPRSEENDPFSGMVEQLQNRRMAQRQSSATSQPVVPQPTAEELTATDDNGEEDVPPPWRKG